MRLKWCMGCGCGTVGRESVPLFLDRGLNYVSKENCLCKLVCKLVKLAIALKRKKEKKKRPGMGHIFK